MSASSFSSISSLLSRRLSITNGGARSRARFQKTLLTGTLKTNAIETVYVANPLYSQAGIAVNTDSTDTNPMVSLSASYQL
jgi:hypothetical protein